MKTPTRGLGTRAAHVGVRASALGPAGERPNALPLFQTSNYQYADAAAADAAAEGRAYIYSRYANPTIEAFESCVADLEGAEGGVAFASGMAALAAAVFATAPGGEVLVSEGIYGGTTELLRDMAPRFGITSRVVRGWDTESVRAAIGPGTRALLVETVSNPLLRVADLPALGTLAAETGIVLIVDSTFTTPCLVRPLAHGATLVIHSVSKFISGHGDVIGGIVLGSQEALREVKHTRKLLGGVMDPFCAWLAARGLRTLPLRMQRQCATAAHLADVLAGLPGVKRVHYPTRSDHPDSARARALMSTGGALVSFELTDGAAARRFYDRVAVITRAASLGEVTSLLTHPASFSHRGLSPAERAQAGIAEGLIRLSVGIEDAGDLEADVRQALGDA